MKEWSLSDGPVNSDTQQELTLTLKTTKPTKKTFLYQEIGLLGAFRVYCSSLAFSNTWKLLSLYIRYLYDLVTRYTVCDVNYKNVKCIILYSITWLSLIQYDVIEYMTLYILWHIMMVCSEEFALRKSKRNPHVLVLSLNPEADLA